MKTIHTNIIKPSTDSTAQAASGRKHEQVRAAKPKNIKFGGYHLGGIIGTLSREEIYEDRADWIMRND